MRSIKSLLEELKTSKYKKQEEKAVNEYNFIAQINKNLEKLEENTVITLPLQETHWLSQASKEKLIEQIQIKKISENNIEITVKNDKKTYNSDVFSKKINESMIYAAKSLNLSENFDKNSEDELLKAFLIGIIGNFTHLSEVNDKIKHDIVLKTNKFLNESSKLSNSPIQFLSVLKQSHPWIGEIIDLHGLSDGATALIALTDNSEIEVVVRPAKYGKNHHEHRSGW